LSLDIQGVTSENESVNISYEGDSVDVVVEENATTGVVEQNESVINPVSGESISSSLSGLLEDITGTVSSSGPGFTSSTDVGGNSTLGIISVLGGLGLIITSPKGRRRKR